MSKYLIGQLSDIDPKGSRTIVVHNLEIALFRLSDGEIFAVENKCPHKGGLYLKGWYAEERSTVLCTTGRLICKQGMYTNLMMAA